MKEGRGRKSIKRKEGKEEKIGNEKGRGRS